MNSLGSETEDIAELISSSAGGQVWLETRLEQLECGCEGKRRMLCACEAWLSGAISVWQECREGLAVQKAAQPRSVTEMFCVSTVVSLTALCSEIYSFKTCFHGVL